MSGDSLIDLNSVPHSATPIPLQIVFQGGGAKLCLLMAVCDVLKRYEASNRIVVTRVAGSSAGAIAAVMLASDKALATYKAELKSIGQTYLAKMRVNRFLGAWRILQGGAYFHEINLEKFFRELVCDNDGPKVVGDLRCEPQLYFTDLYSRTARASTSEEPIPKALARSCRFPFAFVGYDAGDTQVDGGLALNLPVDQLKRDESINGSVIGIGFSSGFGDQEKSNLLSYTQQLYSAAIESGVARSEAILSHRNFFRIETGIGTFDFEKALSEGFDVHYKLVARQFQTWLEEWIRLFGPIELTPPAPSARQTYRLIRPPLTNIPLAPAIVRELDERKPAVHVKSASTYEVALFDDHGNFANKYRSRNIMKFSVSKPTNLIQLTFQTGKEGSFTDIDLGCAAVNSKGASLTFALHVQELPIPDELLKTFRIYLFFENPLSPDDPHQPYLVDYQYQAINPYPTLGRSPVYSILASRAEADEMILAAAFPRSEFSHYFVDHDIATRTPEQLNEMECNISPEEIAPSQYLPLTEFMDIMHLEHPPERYFLVGRMIKDNAPNKYFGIVVE
jgi:predicted acylesterase/phospholipase RssA